jgi:hypothetical protein
MLMIPFLMQPCNTYSALQAEFGMFFSYRREKLGAPSQCPLKQGEMRQNPPVSVIIAA